MPSRSKQAAKRGGTVAFAAVLTIATGAAFLAGSHLRSQNTGSASLRLQPASSSTRLAQVAGPGGALSAAEDTPLQVSRERADKAGASRQREEVQTAAAAETFENVYNLVREHYVDPLPTDGKMSRGVVKGMITSLGDPNSFFLEPEQRTLLENEAGEGRYAGIGAVTTIRSAKKDGYTEDKIVVVAPLPESPAAKAGLQSGDVITHINGRWVLGSNPMLEVDRVYKKVQNRTASEEELQKATDAATARVKGGINLIAALMKLRTGADEQMTLTVQRPGTTAPLRVALTTAVTETEPVSYKTVTLPNGGSAFYLRLGVFSDRTAKAFREALAQAPKDAPVVLDLRGNPGGTMESAQMIDAALTQGGTFLTELGANGKRTPIKSPVSTSRTPRPVSVLVDGGTASYAEALAASLADKGVGTLVGTNTFGKGMVQMLYPLPDGSGFTLTRGKMVGPRSTDWDKVGLTPKVAVRAGATEDEVLSAAYSALSQRVSAAGGSVASAERGRIR